MKNFLIAFSIFIVWAIFGLWLYSWLGDDKENIALSEDLIENPEDLRASNTLNKTNSSEKRSESFENKSDGDKIHLSQSEGLTANTLKGDIIFRYGEGILSLFNSNKIIIPAATKNFIYRTKEYLETHPSKELVIISFYSPKENSVSPNYGIQRGNILKSMLISADIPINKVHVKPVIKETDTDTEGYFKSSISLLLKPLELESLTENPVKIPPSFTFYPDYASSGILTNAKLNNLGEKLKIELDNNPKLNIKIIAHTDNVGGSIDNYNAGLDHAKQMKYFLINKNDIEATRIIPSSKGETLPLVNNDSKKNRNINRRIEINYTY